MVRKRYLRAIWFCLSVAVLGVGTSQARFLTAQQAKKSPRGRVACLPSPTMGTRYIDPAALGQHSYGFCLFEKNGIVYTCRGGHIDITHLRKVSDWTAYLAFHIRQAMLKDHTQLSFELLEPSRYHVRVRYPHNWRSLTATEKYEIATDAAITLGQYLAYMGSVWHEILTWHGFKGAGVYPEYHSAFSWEDNYSNVMGGYIADMALRDCDHDFEEAMALLLDQEIQRLEPRSKHIARQAGEAVRNEWFTGGFIFCTMLKRHLDTGLDDGWITPWLIPTVADCESVEPILYPAPSLKPLRDYGFHVGVEIDPKVWEKNKILRIVYVDPDNNRGRIVPEKHFGPIIEHIRVTAIQRYGPHADIYELPSATQSDSQTARVLRQLDFLSQPVVFASRFTANRSSSVADDSDQKGCSKLIRGDLNGDCKVDVLDLAAFASYWLAEDRS